MTPEQKERRNFAREIAQNILEYRNFVKESLEQADLCTKMADEFAKAGKYDKSNDCIAICDEYLDMVRKVNPKIDALKKQLAEYVNIVKQLERYE